MQEKPTTVHGLVNPCMGYAIEAVQKGMTQSMAAIRFGIPINILNPHYRDNPKAPIT